MEQSADIVRESKAIKILLFFIHNRGKEIWPQFCGQVTAQMVVSFAQCWLKLSLTAIHYIIYVCDFWTQTRKKNKILSRIKQPSL